LNYRCESVRIRNGPVRHFANRSQAMSRLSQSLRIEFLEIDRKCSSILPINDFNKT
jgi:hypothetical protein